LKVQFFIKYCSFVLIQKNEKIKASERKAKIFPKSLNLS
jgi:hypothetical protein